ncbi:hypothetical protein BGW37DRAFT_520562 [Umbelopsis sp. PMI_123]|nr:hypothetical protein BGW37DRAFT_520562 [Umbelopsis sp. PMI_123]
MEQQRNKPTLQQPSKTDELVAINNHIDNVIDFSAAAKDHEQNQTLSQAPHLIHYEEFSFIQPQSQTEHISVQSSQDNYYIVARSDDIDTITEDEVSDNNNKNTHSDTKSVSSLECEGMHTYPQDEIVDFHNRAAITVPSRSSSTVPQGLSIQDVDAARKVNVLSNDIQDDIDITTSSSQSTLSQSSSKTLIGKPKAALYSNKSTPYTSVISGLSTPAKISHSNTHHYLPATEGADQVVIDVKHEIIDPDFDTSLQEKRRHVNKRGVCNLMTIIIILAIIVFMFAGYPLSLYISKQLHPNDTNPSYSKN